MELEHRADGLDERKGDQRSQAVHLVAGGVLGAVLLSFILQNTATVELSWLFFSFSTPMWLFVIIIAVVTLGLGKVGGYFFRRSKSKSKGKADSKKK